MEIQNIIPVSCNFLLSREVGVRALLLPAQSHCCQHRGGSRLSEMWQTKLFGVVMSKDSVLSLPIMGPCLHSCCCLEKNQCRVLLRSCFGKRHQQIVEDSLPTSKMVTSGFVFFYFILFFLSFLFFLIHLWGRKIQMLKQFLCRGGKCWNATARNPSEKRYRSYIRLPVEIIWSGRPERPAGILFHQRLMEASHSNVLKAVEN